MYKEVFRKQILKGGKAVLIHQKLYIGGNEKCYNINTPSISRTFKKNSNNIQSMSLDIPI